MIAAYVETVSLKHYPCQLSQYSWDQHRQFVCRGGKKRNTVVWTSGVGADTGVLSIRNGRRSSGLPKHTVIVMKKFAVSAKSEGHDWCLLFRKPGE